MAIKGPVNWRMSIYGPLWSSI